MRELKKQDMIDILYGCAVLGTGGGGPLEEGLAMMQKHFDNDEVLQLISLDELPDDEYVVTPYGCGAPSATGLNPKFKDLEVSEVVPSVLAMEALEEALGKKIYAVGSTELGGANTAEALHAALEKGVPLLDADPAGRSVPELQHSTYYVKGVPIYPMGVATRFGEKIVIQNVQNDLRAEDIVRAIAVASDNMVGVADHANVGKVIKETSLCGLGQSSPNPVLSTMNFFWDEYVAHVTKKECPAKVCPEMVKYYILPDKCNGCTLCSRICPVNAIQGERRTPHTVIQSECIKCGSCLDTCKRGAIVKL